MQFVYDLFLVLHFVGLASLLAHTVAFAALAPRLARR